MSASPKGWDGNRTFIFYSNFFIKDKSKGIKTALLNLFARTKGVEVCLLIIHMKMMVNLCDKNIGEKDNIF